jgi:TonB family protein
MIWTLLAAVAAQAGAAGPPRPVQELGSLIRAGDYPADAMRRGAQGQVRFTVAVDATGAVTGCTVDATSNDADLDRATCDLVRQRAHFTPATDGAGRPVAGSFTAIIGWRLRTAAAAVPTGEFVALTTLRISRAGDAHCSETVAGHAVPAGDPESCGHLAGSTATAALRRLHRDAVLTLLYEVLRADAANSAAPPGSLVEEHEAQLGIDPQGRPVACHATVDRVVHPLAGLGHLADLCAYRPATPNGLFPVVAGQSGVRPERIHSILTLQTEQQGSQPLR